MKKLFMILTIIVFSATLACAADVLHEWDAVVGADGYRLYVIGLITHPATDRWIEREVKIANEDLPRPQLWQG